MPVCIARVLESICLRDYETIGSTFCYVVTALHDSS